MSRTIKFENAESYRVVFDLPERTWHPSSTIAYGPYATIALANQAGKRESGQWGEHPKVPYRIQRTTTDWQDVE